MSYGALSWATIHPSVINEAARPIRTAELTRRAQGALRYRCPVSGGFLLVTDDETLHRLEQLPARIRCADCREMHLLVEAEVVGPHAPIVARPATP